MGIRENLREVEERIVSACQRAGRKRNEVTLIAVSKTHPAEAVEEALSCGQMFFGENRVQELREKSAQLKGQEGVLWHLIGTLQTNKVKYLPEIPQLTMVHSVDSSKLALEMDRRFRQAGYQADILVEVNMAREDTKQGILPEEAGALVREIAALPALRIKGLMTIAPFTEDAETNRVHFAGLRTLLAQLNAEAVLPQPMTELSMGMSGDYEVAIEEGATLIRVGTAIFGTRDYTS